MTFKTDSVRHAAAATTYLAGAVLGALLFGHLTDRHGRRKLFLVTLATYSLATLGTGLSVNATMFFICRFFTGLGIGGEYAAINSAVDELIPGKVRGTVDLIVNATFWMGATLGSLAALFLMGGHVIPVHWGWRLAFAVGGTLGFLLLRLAVPESPRWLMLRGREQEAERIVSGIETTVSKHEHLEPVREKKLRIRSRDHTPLGDIFKNMLGENRKRSVLGLTLMVGQAFFFNAIFFTFGLIAKQFYHVPDAKLPLQLMPFAIASLLGPIVLGPLFDKVGRKPMITATYGTAGILLVATAVLFATDTIALKGLIICFSVIFFTASSAASAAYLTVSEIFPLDPRLCHRDFLCPGHLDRRGGRSRPVRHAHRQRFEDAAHDGLSAGCRPHARGRRRRVLHWSRGRGQVAGISVEAAAKRRLRERIPHHHLSLLGTKRRNPAAINSALIKCIP